MRKPPNFLAQLVGHTPQLIWGVEVRMPGRIVINRFPVSDVKRLFHVVELMRKQHPTAQVRVVADTYEEAS